MENYDYITIRKDIDNLNHKIDYLTTAVAEIKSIIAENRGANIPHRLTSMETRIHDIEKYNASIVNHLKTIDINTADIQEIKAFQYKAVGVISFLSFLFTIIGKIIMDKIF
jgi:hypothetical protein